MEENLTPKETNGAARKTFGLEQRRIGRTWRDFRRATACCSGRMDAWKTKAKAKEEAL